ncbi:MAG TPA: molybdopterin-guanine dinucleotide biosynthesis protein B [Anaeromyxobacteraceae bacterium]|nr:molybdopterin-guanine dinucleotide biosynthesis protein B [Anaeromyxobacteraceae bacterium]
MPARRPPVVVFSGPSGSGKTTLLVKLIPALMARGLTVAALKHSGHPHSFDRPGKDSARLRRAGAIAVALEGPDELAYFGPPVRKLRALAALLPPCSIVVAEGFREAHLPRVLVHRGPKRLEPPRSRRGEVIAVVSDVEVPLPVPRFSRSEVEGLADFLAHFAGARRRGSRPWARARASPSRWAER